MNATQLKEQFEALAYKALNNGLSVEVINYATQHAMLVVSEIDHARRRHAAVLVSGGLPSESLERACKWL